MTRPWSCPRWCSQSKGAIFVIKYCVVYCGGGGWNFLWNWKQVIPLKSRAFPYWDWPFPPVYPLFYDSTRLFMSSLRPYSSPSVYSFFPSEGLNSPWVLIDQDLVLRVRLISSADRSLGVLPCNHVAFRWKSRTLYYIKAVATKVHSSIWANHVLLIRRSISAILLPKVSTYFLGSFVSLVLCKACTSVQTAEELICCYFWIMAKKTLVMDFSCPKSFL